MSWEEEASLILLKRREVLTAPLDGEGALEALTTRLQTQQSAAVSQAKGPVNPNQLCDLIRLGFRYLQQILNSRWETSVRQLEK